MANNMTSTQPTVSPFLEPGLRTKPRSLAILQLSRDNLLPIYLQEPSGEHDGYAEGAVVNTRYGSFPHSTMLNVPWGSQIRASKVDTGSRGRKRKRGPKDEASRDDAAEENQPETTTDNNNNKDASEATGVKQAVADDSGFIHVLPPTPELWTQSLPHRTQVVYTPDYSYILHRIRARPGSTIIEAGAGSGSFTHASVRAVYNGYPSSAENKKGKVFSFEYHEERFHKMKKELTDHNLDGLVHLTHRDVYNGGFLIDGKSPGADAIFLDLPKPWEALPHLSRSRPTFGAKEGEDTTAEWVSPLNPKRAVHICTFSPCIEQVTRTVSAMRRLGWVDIDMVEIANRKLHTIRDRVGLHYQTDRGVNVSPHDVEEALERLAEIEERVREQAARPRDAEDADTDMKNGDDAAAKKEEDKEQPPYQTPWIDGRLITKGEPEIKTHTSYLVFAVLPREWTEEDEAAAFAKYPCGKEKAVVGSIDKQTRKKERREQLQKIGDRKARRKERDAKIAEAVE